MRPIIIEMGNYSTKIGYAGESFPRIDIPSIFGRPDPKLNAEMKNYLINLFGLSELPDLFCGDTAIYYSKLLEKIPLIYNEDFFDMDLLEYFLEYISYTYNFKLKGQDFILIQPFNSKVLQSLGELLFAKYECKSIIPVIQPFSDLVSSGVENGSALIVDIGHYNCNITPIFRGNVVSEGLLRAFIGGDNITRLLEAEIIPLMEDKESSYIIDTYNLATDIKESLAFVSLSPKRDFKEAMEGKLTKIIPLFKGETIELHIPLYNSCEILFNPGLFGINEYSIKDLIIKSILSCTNTLRQEIANNIIITGGTSALNGLRERLIREMIGQLGELEFNITSYREINDPRYSAWIGASKIFASGQDLSPIRIKLEDYTRIGGELKIDLDYYTNMTEISLGSLTTQLNSMNMLDIALPTNYIYKILLNTLVQYRRINISKISEIIRIPEIRVLKMIYTLLARNLINGEVDQESFDFINFEFGKKRELSAVPKTSADKVSSTERFAGYQEKEVNISEGLRKKVLAAQETTEQITNDENLPTFLKIDEIKKKEWEKMESPVLTENKIKKLKKTVKIEISPQMNTTESPNIENIPKRKKVPFQETEFTFQKIDQVSQTEWESEDSPVLTPEKEKKMRIKKFQRLKEITELIPEPQEVQIEPKRNNQLPEELLSQPSFLYYDKSKGNNQDNKLKDREINDAKSYFSLLDSRTKPKEIKKLEPKLLTSLDPQEDEGTIKETHQDKKSSLLLGDIPESSKIDKNKNKLLGIEKTEKPRDARLLVPNVPTFKLLENKFEEKMDDDKVEIDGLLKSSRQEVKRNNVNISEDLPTFLKFDKITSEQLKKIKELEEEEKRKKEKEPKLL
ncbi:MAG: hypothetical protein ACTSWR_01445 [Candidatus Helarchaeota archaeon]